MSRACFAPRGRFRRDPERRACLLEGGHARSQVVRIGQGAGRWSGLAKCFKRRHRYVPPLAQARQVKASQRPECLP